MDVTKQLCAIVKSLNVNFTLNDRKLTAEEVFSPTGLLPALARRADQLSSLCLGYGIGATFEDAEKSLMGVQVAFDEATPNILRLMCITDIVMELINSSPSKAQTPLDELMYD